MAYVIAAMAAVYVIWLCWRYRLHRDRMSEGTARTARMTIAIVAWVAAVIVIAACVVPAAGATRWPAPEKLQRCFVELQKMKDPKLRRWCTYWSARLP